MSGSLLTCAKCEKVYSASLGHCPHCMPIPPGCIFTAIVLVIGLVGGAYWVFNKLAEPDPVTILREQLHAAEQDFSHYAGNCQVLTVRKSRTEGLVAEGEVDIAQGEVLKGPVKPEQEQQFRKLLGAEMRLPPWQVNGWRSALEGRAAAAKSMAPDLRLQLDRETKEASAACSSRDQAKRQVVKLRGDLQREEWKRR